MLEIIFDTFFVSTDVIIKSIIALLLSLVIGIVVSQVYRYTHSGIHYEPAMLSTLVLLAPVVTTVMLFIQGDLALTLGLVGALAIIRFRTPIKGTRDMVYLFWTIAIGIGMGTFNWMLAIIASSIISFILILFYLLKYESMPKSEYILVVSGIEVRSAEIVREYVRKFDENAKIRSSKYIGDSWELVFEIQIKKTNTLNDNIFIEEINNTSGVQKVTLLAPQISLPA